MCTYICMYVCEGNYKTFKQIYHDDDNLWNLNSFETTHKFIDRIGCVIATTNRHIYRWKLFFFFILFFLENVHKETWHKFIHPLPHWPEKQNVKKQNWILKSEAEYIFPFCLLCKCLQQHLSFVTSTHDTNREKRVTHKSNNHTKALVAGISREPLKIGKQTAAFSNNNNDNNIYNNNHNNNNSGL